MSKQIFSFHLAEVPLREVPGLLRVSALYPGLLHGESFATMSLGEPIFSLRRYDMRRLAFFAWWREESYLEHYLATQPWLNDGWHVRMRLYRKWGEIAELKGAVVDPGRAEPGQPVVAVTLARLRLSETMRFVRWGKPVEAQVRDHPGQALALAAIRPLNTFSTFSVWKSEAEMVHMVHGRDQNGDGESHKQAMQERNRRDFHHEFSTMRFTPFKEVGDWNGRGNYTGFKKLSSTEGP